MRVVKRVKHFFYERLLVDTDVLDLLIFVQNLHLVEGLEELLDDVRDDNLGLEEASFTGAPETLHKEDARLHTHTHHASIHTGELLGDRGKLGDIPRVLQAWKGSFQSAPASRVAFPW